MLLHQSKDSAQLGRRESDVERDPRRIEPQLRRPVVAIDVDVGRLRPVVAVEVEAIRTAPQNRRHPGSPIEDTQRGSPSTVPRPRMGGSTGVWCYPTDAQRRAVTS